MAKLSTLIQRIAALFASATVAFGGLVGSDRPECIYGPPEDIYGPPIDESVEPFQCVYGPPSVFTVDDEPVEGADEQ